MCVTRERRAFTLVEMVVVIAIIGILAGLILPAIGRARAKARETQCRSDLGQIGKFLLMYRQDTNVDGYERNPPRLTHLYRKADGSEGRYVKQPALFLCPSDKSDGGEGGKPDIPEISSDDQFDELDEPNNTAPHTTNCASSYMYEFARTKCSWGWQTYISLPPSKRADPDKSLNLDDPNVILDAESVTTWEEVKFAQMTYGDNWWNANVPQTEWSGYPRTRFPIIRCFWHADDPTVDDPRQVLNLSYMCHVFRSGARWEYAARDP